MSRTYIVYKASSPFTDPITLHNPLDPLLSSAMSTCILLVHIAKRGEGCVKKCVSDRKNEKGNYAKASFDWMNRVSDNK